jgi:hypothetical protein
VELIYLNADTARRSAHARQDVISLDCVETRHTGEENRGALEDASGIDEPATRLPTAGVNIGLTVGNTPKVERPTAPNRLQGLAEVVQDGVITQESCHSDDFTSRPDGPIVLPPIGPDKAGARNEVGTSPVAVSLGRSSKQSRSSSVCTSIAATYDTANRADREPGRFRTGRTLFLGLSGRLSGHYRPDT